MVTTAANRRLDPVPFQAHIELLEQCLAQRDAIVARIEDVLNAQRKPLEYVQNGPLLSRQIEDCFFTVAGGGHPRSRDELEAAHWADGFTPRRIAGLHNGPADPAEMAMRVFHLWRQTRWPGRNARVRYAHTLFNLFIIRRLELLSMRVWDDAQDERGTSADQRLGQIQQGLDRVWAAKTADQPVLVRDARWLIQLAQCLATDDLGAYFRVAERIDRLAPGHALEVRRAGVAMTGGHLRSQLRYQSMKMAVPLEDAALLSHTRTSNALDFALLVEDLVTLLAAYEEADRRGDIRARLALADAICQGISADPELFVNRIDLLRACSMIEDLFVETDAEGRTRYTAMGRRHVQRVEEYERLLRRLVQPLRDDCCRFRPIAGTYSPYGVLYGFSSDLLKHMALKASQPDAETRFSLEDVFESGDASVEKLAWVAGWRKLPHLSRDVQRQFEYPQPFADEIFSRAEQALRRGASPDTTVAAGSGRIVVVPEHQPPGATGMSIPAIPLQHVKSSDRQLVAEGKAQACDEARLLADRREAKYLVSYRTAGGWNAISKDVLTHVLATGRDVTIEGLPATAAALLMLMCPGLVVTSAGRG